MVAGEEAGMCARRIALVVVIAVCTAAVLQFPSAAPAARRPLVLITVDLRGQLEPCDCRAGILGGFPRRATKIARLRPGLILDAGDMIAQASPYDLLRLRFMHALCGELGYDALNVGRREASFSRVELLRLAKDSPVPLISANVADAEGRRLLPGHVALLRWGTTVRVLGAVTTQADPGKGVRVLDPVVALKREVARLEERPVLTVLLACLDARELERVLKDVPGIDLVLGGRVPRGSSRLESLAGVPCFLVQGKGQYAGVVGLEKREARWRPISGRRVVLGPDVPSRRRIDARIRSFELSLKDLDLLRRNEDTSPYVGSATCAACHGAIHRSWRETTHARALGALRPDKGRFDPHCLRCHVTGPGEGGYVSGEKTPQFSGVGCEACHGPARAHAEAPVTEKRPRTTGKPRARCLSCHTSDHSRPFHEKERFAAIEHWLPGKVRTR